MARFCWSPTTYTLSNERKGIINLTFLVEMSAKRNIVNEIGPEANFGLIFENLLFKTDPNEKVYPFSIYYRYLYRCDFIFINLWRTWAGYFYCYINLDGLLMDRIWKKGIRKLLLLTLTPPTESKLLPTDRHARSGLLNSYICYLHYIYMMSLRR